MTDFSCLFIRYNIWYICIFLFDSQIAPKQAENILTFKYKEAKSSKSLEL